MDRRVLLAMALAALVLVLNSILFGPGERTAPTPEQREMEVATPPAASGQREPPALQESGSPGLAEERTPPDGMLRGEAPGGGTEPIRVDTRLFSAELDPVGGAIRSWRLKQYTDAADQEADLVRSKDLGALWFSLRTRTGIIRTDSTLYQSEVHKSDGTTTVRFHVRDRSGIEVEKVYTIREGQYDCGLEIRVRGVRDGDAGSWELGWMDGLPLLEKDRGQEQHAVASVALFGKEYYRTGAGGGVFGCAPGGQGKKTEVHEGTLSWFGVRTKYFLGALILDQPGERRVSASFDGQEHLAAAVLSEPLSADGSASRAYQLYLGPIRYRTLEAYGVGLERVQDLGPGIIRPFSKLLMKFFVAVNKVVPNYGLEILILSILTRLVFYPLTKKSMQSMRRMQELKPEMERINAKFKNEPEKRNREIMELYRKNKINPLGGCLPVLVQLPVLSGLYYVLANAVELRKAHFGLWVHDLSAPDTVGYVAGFPVNILPLIMAGTMVWQQKITPTDPRQASIGYVMPIFFTFLFYSTPSGLVFYWTISNLMTVLQQIWMNRHQTPLAIEEIPAKARPARKR